MPSAATLLQLMPPEDRPRERLLRSGGTALSDAELLAVLLRTNNRALLYDTGSRFGDFDMGSRIVAPYLFSEGVDELDSLVISNGDNDHAGGYHGLVALIHAKRVLSGEPERIGQGLERCLAGQQWGMGELNVSVLWPEDEPPSGKANNRSCVVLIEGDKLRILLLGDIEKSVERRLLENATAKSKLANIDVLLVPHHGSKTSSSAALLKHLRPKYAVFSVGYKNRYHHPNKQVLQRYQREGSEVLRTDWHGAIDFRWDNTGQLKVTKQRSSKPKPWYNNAN